MNPNGPPRKPHGPENLTFAGLTSANQGLSEESFGWLSSWSHLLSASAMASACIDAMAHMESLSVNDDSEDLVARAAEIEIVGAKLAELVIYADALANRFGLDLGSCIREKFNHISGKCSSTHRL